MSPATQTRPELLIIGHVSRDLVGEHASLGGPAAFAARAAAAMGIDTAVVTMAPDRFPLMAPLRNDPRIQLRAHACPQETVFALDYSQAVRSISLIHRAPVLRPRHIPRAWRNIPVCYIAPAIGECDRRVVAALGAQQVVVGAQGWLRHTGSHGLLKPTVADEMLHPPANVSAMVFSELDHPDADAIAEQVARRGVVVVLTRGRAGATLISATQREHIPAFAAQEVDPTGAGDVFGVVFTLARARGHSLRTAALHGAKAAAKVVEGPGLGNLTAFDLAAV